MTTNHALQKLVRHLHRSLFHSVPNTGPREVDLSRLKPVQPAFDLTEYSIEFDVYLRKQVDESLETPLPVIPYMDRVPKISNRFTPEPWDPEDPKH